MHRLPDLFHAGTAVGRRDHELLERFTSRVGTDDEVAEAAFAVLVDRHGPMVLRTCRSVLGDRDRADDAFQATFLVLASRARTVRREGSVGAWLHGVALRVAANSRSSEARRRRHERNYAETSSPSSGCAEGGFDDQDAVIHEEIGRLPDQYRSAVVLCYLQGLTHDQAAERLGWPVGTVKRRLAWARDRLRVRLTHRGVEPPGLETARTPDPTAALIPTALAEATVRGASFIALGKAAPAGMVPAQALLLMEGVLKAMTTRSAILTASLVAAGFATAGFGVAAISAPGAGSQPAAQQPATPPPAAPKPILRLPAEPSPEARATALKRSEENVRKLVDGYETETNALREALQKATTPEERQALFQKRANPAAVAGALLYEAETTPGTPAAEEALFWIVTHLPAGSMAETAKDVIARDHAASEKIGSLLTPRHIGMSGSRATERLLRAILDRNPGREIRAETCLQLARFLDGQSSDARMLRFYDPAQFGELASTIQKEAWGRDYPERIQRMDPDALKRESEALYERAAREFGDVPLPHPLPQLTGDLLLPGRPTTIGEVAKAYLHESRDLGVGCLAPEIEGVDLEGRPMKLSDYRGKVVLLYFCASDQIRPSNGDRPAPVTEGIRRVADQHAKDAFALLGVSTASVNAPVDRETFKEYVKSSGLPARFWWDLGPDDAPGPIQKAWNARMGLYVLDHRGVIRLKENPPGLVEYVVATLLKEKEAEDARPAPRR